MEGVVNVEWHGQDYLHLKWHMVCSGLATPGLIGPHFLPHRLNGEQYLHFRRNDLPNLLEDVPLCQCQQMWFIHDGTPAHFHVSVGRYG